MSAMFEYLGATERTAIRRPLPEDGPEFIAKARASRELHHPWITAAKDADAYGAYLTRLAQPSTEGFLVVRRAVDPADDEIAGFITVSQIIRGVLESAFVGYAGFVGLTGRGHMSDGLSLVVDYAFGRLHLHRLEVNMQPSNTASRELARRCGFRREGYSPNYLYIDGAWRDHERWALTTEQPRPQRG